MIDQLENDPSSGLPFSPFPSSFAVSRIRSRICRCNIYNTSCEIARAWQRTVELIRSTRYVSENFSPDSADSPSFKNRVSRSTDRMTTSTEKDVSSDKVSAIVASKESSNFRHLCAPIIAHVITSN